MAWSSSSRSPLSSIRVFQSVRHLPTYFSSLSLFAFGSCVRVSAGAVGSLSALPPCRTRSASLPISTSSIPSLGVSPCIAATLRSQRPESSASVLSAQRFGAPFMLSPVSTTISRVGQAAGSRVSAQPPVSISPAPPNNARTRPCENSQKTVVGSTLSGTYKRTPTTYRRRSEFSHGLALQRTEAGGGAFSAIHVLRRQPPSLSLSPSGGRAHLP